MSSDEEQRFHISFHIQAWPKGIRREDLAKEFSGCDSIVQIVMLHDKDGGQKHYQVMSMDGERSEPMALHEQWEAWYVLGRALSQLMDKNDPAHGWQQQVTEGMIEVCQAMRKDGRKKQDIGLLDASGRSILR